MFLHGPFDVPADFMRAEAEGTEAKQEQQITTIEGLSLEDFLQEGQIDDPQ